MLLIIDASVIISVLVSDNNSYGRDILTLAYSKKIDLVTTKEIFEELRTTSKSEDIKRLTRYKPAKFGSFIAWYKYNAMFITIPSDQQSPEISRDKNDVMYLLLARVSKADYIITIDKDLLVLKKVGGTLIVDPEKFMKLEARKF